VGGPDGDARRQALQNNRLGFFLPVKTQLKRANEPCQDAFAWTYLAETSAFI
jgi:hypothetical protein